MLTKFHPYSSFQKKFTVVVIWLIALALIVTSIKFILEAEVEVILLIPFTFFGLFIAFGIIFRSKTARWFMLLSAYTLFFSPLVAYVMLEEALPSIKIATYLILLTLIVYVFSNKKAISLFDIESNPSEHLIFILLSITVNSLYFYIFKVV